MKEDKTVPKNKDNDVHLIDTEKANRLQDKLRNIPARANNHQNVTDDKRDIPHQEFRNFSTKQFFTDSGKGTNPAKHKPNGARA